VISGRERSEDPGQAGPVAAIVGASQGIGRACAIDLARHGFDVAAVARPKSTSSGNGLADVIDKVRACGRKALAVEADISQRADAESIIGEVLEGLGRIDVLLMSANWIDHSEGGSYSSRFAEMRRDSIVGHVETTILSHLLILRDITEVFVRQNKGIVVNITQNRSSNSRSPQWPMFREPPLMERLQSTDHAFGAVMVPIVRGATERIAPALSAEMGEAGCVVVTLDPGLTLSKPGLEALFAKTKRYQGAYSTSDAHSVMVPARAVTYIATCRNPSVFNGMFVDAEDLVRTFGLMTEEEIHPPLGGDVQPVEAIPPIGGWAHPR